MWLALFAALFLATPFAAPAATLDGLELEVGYFFPDAQTPAPGDIVSVNLALNGGDPVELVVIGDGIDAVIDSNVGLLAEIDFSTTEHALTISGFRSNYTLLPFNGVIVRDSENVLPSFAGLTQIGGDVPVVSSFSADALFFNLAGLSGLSTLDDPTATFAFQVVPLPASLPLLLGGLAAFGVVRRARRSPVA